MGPDKLTRQAIPESVDKACKPYLEYARSFMEDVSERCGLDVPSVDPEVRISVPAAGEIHHIVRFPVRTAERRYIEQSILSDKFENHNFAKEA